MPAMPVDVMDILHLIAKDTPALPTEDLPQETIFTTARDINATNVENPLQDIKNLIVML
jgi:hypothetical protein